MMSQDHLDNEISVSAELTEAGAKTGAKSRAISSIDRFVGAITDIGSAHLEGFAERRRAKTRGEVALIDAAVQHGIDKIGSSPELAERAFGKHFEKVLKQQENIEAVVHEAKVDLIEGPQDYDDTEGSMSEEFFDRFEHYSASASTAELRQRWGRVLASEIRQPGTFSAKVLRVVDELDSSTAALFERVCQFRVGSCLYRPLMQELSYSERVALIGAGLLVDPGVSGQHTVFASASTPDGKELWIGGSINLVFGLPKDGIQEDAFSDLLVRNGEQVGVHVYALTDAGMAISSILPDDSETLVRMIASRLAEHVDDNKLLLYRPEANGNLTMCGYAEPASAHNS